MGCPKSVMCILAHMLHSGAAVSTKVHLGEGLEIVCLLARVGKVKGPTLGASRDGWAGVQDGEVADLGGDAQGVVSTVTQ